jgi:hypothetical protein
VLALMSFAVRLVSKSLATAKVRASKHAPRLVDAHVLGPRRLMLETLVTILTITSKINL